MESLQDPFLNEGKRLKTEIACTLVPAVNRVKAAYKTLDQRVDTAYGQGVVQFNKACTDIEATMSIEQTEFQTAYQATKVIHLYMRLLSLTTPMKKNIDILFERLRLEYAVRDQLWADVRKAVDEIGILLVNNVMRN